MLLWCLEGGVVGAVVLSAVVLSAAEERSHTVHGRLCMGRQRNGVSNNDTRVGDG